MALVYIAMLHNFWSDIVCKQATCSVDIQYSV